MGIFDDAIREHLDLKRRQGVDESELQQLEDEAFGLPARPGDPDFPETGEVPAEEQARGEPAPAPEGAEAAGKAEAPAPEAPADAAPAAEQAEDEAPPHGDALLADPDAEPEAPPADERLVEDEGAAGFTTTEREAIGDQPTELFDQAPEPLDLGELDLDLKDELDDVATIGDEPEAGDELPEDEPPPAVHEEDAPVEAEAPVDEIEVVEETEPASDEAESAAEPEPAGGEEAEDVLEETPEFLRDNPDDDELWFEQGEPKDFDF